MTAKFDAFRDALHALCVEHGFRLDMDGCWDFDHLVASVDGEHGLHASIEEKIPPTPEELAEEAAFELIRKRSKGNMRISSDPTDPAYIDARPRRVYVNDREVPDWHIADEFRRSVITRDGKVHHGSVLIERLGDGGAPAVEPVVNAGFSGVFVHVPDAPPVPNAPEPPPAKPTAIKTKHNKRR